MHGLGAKAIFQAPGTEKLLYLLTLLSLSYFRLWNPEGGVESALQY